LVYCVLLEILHLRPEPIVEDVYSRKLESRRTLFSVCVVSCALFHQVKSSVQVWVNESQKGQLLCENMTVTPHHQ